MRVSAVSCEIYAQDNEREVLTQEEKEIESSKLCLYISFFFEDVNSRKLQETVHHVRSKDIGPMFCDIPSQFFFNDDAEFLKVIEAISISKLQPAVPN